MAEQKSRYALLGELFQIAAKDFTEISQILFKLDGAPVTSTSTLLGKRKRAKNKFSNKKMHWTNKELDTLEEFIRNHLQKGGDLSNIDYNTLHFDLGRMKDMKDIHHQIDLYKKASQFTDFRDLPFMSGKSFLDDEYLEENKSISNQNINSKITKSNSINDVKTTPNKKRKTSKSPTRRINDNNNNNNMDTLKAAPPPNSNNIAIIDDKQSLLSEEKIPLSKIVAPQSL